MLSARRAALVQVHSAVLLFGLAGVLGKMTTLPATDIVLGRVAFGGAALAIVLGLRRVPVRAHRRRDLLALAVSGILLAVHWTTFFLAVRASSVAVALLAFSTFPLFTTALEPLLYRVRPRVAEIAIALLILPGVYLLVPSLSLSNPTTLGAAWGLVAGFTFAVLSIWNRHLTSRYPSAVINLYQEATATAVLLPTLFFVHATRGLTVRDVFLLLVLGVLCTALSHTLFIEGLRTLTAQAASMIAALRPVWGIAFASVLLGEIPTFRVLLGGTLIIGAVLLAALLHPSAASSARVRTVSTLPSPAGGPPADTLSH